MKWSCFFVQRASRSFCKCIVDLFSQSSGTCLFLIVLLSSRVLRFFGTPTRSCSSRQETHERQPIAHLIFNLVVRQVIGRSQNQGLENHDRVDRLAPCPLKRWPEFLLWHHAVDRDQRVILGVKALVAV